MFALSKRKQQSKSLAEVNAVALAEISEIFSNIPSADVLFFETHDRHDGSYHEFLRQRLLIGQTNGKPMRKVWIYMNRYDQKISVRHSRGRLDASDFASIELIEPFQSIIHFHPPFSLDELLGDVGRVARYYFLVRGYTDKFSWFADSKEKLFLVFKNLAAVTSPEVRGHSISKGLSNSKPNPPLSVVTAAPSEDKRNTHPERAVATLEADVPSMSDDPLQQHAFSEDGNRSPLSSKHARENDGDIEEEEEGNMLPSLHYMNCRLTITQHQKEGGWYTWV